MVKKRDENCGRAIGRVLVEQRERRKKNNGREVRGPSETSRISEREVPTHLRTEAKKDTGTKRNTYGE